MPKPTNIYCFVECCTNFQSISQPCMRVSPDVLLEAACGGRHRPKSASGGAEPHGARRHAAQAAPQPCVPRQPRANHQVHDAVVPAQKLVRAVPSSCEPLLFVYCAAQLVPSHQRVWQGNRHDPRRLCAGGDRHQGRL